MKDLKVSNHINWLLLLTGALMALNGCASMIKPMAVKSTILVSKDVNDAVFREDDLALVKAGLPGNILMVEGIVRGAPNDYDILIIAAQAFSGYAIMVEDDDPEHATELYLKGREYALRALKQHRGFRKALENGTPFWKAVKKVNSKGYIDALLWTGVCWGQEINLNLDDPMTVVDAADVKAIMLQVKAIDDTYFHGMVHVFFGTYYAILPTIFSGGTKVVTAEFDRAFEISENKFLLAKVYYARYYATLIKDEDLYDRELNEVLDAPSDILPEVALMNAIAKAKAKRLLQDKSKYF